MASRRGTGDGDGEGLGAASAEAGTGALGVSLSFTLASGAEPGDVPAVVQKTADNEAKGGKILRWEKEGADYEAVIEKNGKEWGIKINSDGKVVNKHDESREKGEH